MEEGEQRNSGRGRPPSGLPVGQREAPKPDDGVVAVGAFVCEVAELGDGWL